MYRFLIIVVVIREIVSERSCGRGKTRRFVTVRVTTEPFRSRSLFIPIIMLEKITNNEKYAKRNNTNLKKKRKSAKVATMLRTESIFKKKRERERLVTSACASLCQRSNCAPLSRKLRLLNVVFLSFIPYNPAPQHGQLLTVCRDVFRPVFQRVHHGVVRVGQASYFEWKFPTLLILVFPPCVCACALGRVKWDKKWRQEPESLYHLNGWERKQKEKNHGQNNSLCTTVLVMRESCYWKSDCDVPNLAFGAGWMKNEQV